MGIVGGRRDIDDYVRPRKEMVVGEIRIVGSQETPQLRRGKEWMLARGISQGDRVCQRRVPLNSVGSDCRGYRERDREKASCK